MLQLLSTLQDTELKALHIEFHSVYNEPKRAPEL